VKKHKIAEIVYNRCRAANLKTNGVPISELLISRIIKAQSTAIQIALTTEKQVKIENFGQLKFNEKKADYLDVVKNYKNKGYSGDELRSVVKKVSKDFMNGSSGAIAIKGFRKNK